MISVQELPGRTVKVKGKELLYFSGTSYLGIGKNEAFREQLLEGMKRYGTNYSSSRTSNLQLAIYEETEAFPGAVYRGRSCPYPFFGLPGLSGNCAVNGAGSCFFVCTQCTPGFVQKPGRFLHRKFCRMGPKYSPAIAQKISPIKW